MLTPIKTSMFGVKTTRVLLISLWIWVLSLESLVLSRKDEREITNHNVHSVSLQPPTLVRWNRVIEIRYTKYVVRNTNYHAQFVRSQPRTSVRGNRVIEIRITRYAIRNTLYAIRITQNVIAWWAFAFQYRFLMQILRWKWVRRYCRCWLWSRYQKVGSQRLSD